MVTFIDEWRRKFPSCIVVKRLKQLSRFASLKHNIYIVADPTPVDVDYAAYACEPTMCTRSANLNDLLQLSFQYNNIPTI